MPAFNFKKRFAGAVQAGEKRQTIRRLRRDDRLPAKPGDFLTFYIGMRTKHVRRVGVGICKSVDFVVIQHDGVKVGDIESLEKILNHEKDFGLALVDRFEMARADGFDGWEEFVGFFEKNHGLPFLGWLIKW